MLKRFQRLIELDCYTTTVICDLVIMMMITAILLIELECLFQHLRDNMLGPSESYSKYLMVSVLATCADLGPHKMVAFFEGARALVVTRSFVKH